MDLLLTIDNSPSMKDKQKLLAEALPILLERLTTPRCVRECTEADDCSPAQERQRIPVGGNVDADGRCASGVPEMRPIRDLHVAVITSSMGSHGANGADDVCTRESDDDHARLIGTLRQVSGTYQNLGFLAWNTREKSTGADTDLAIFSDKSRELVEAVGERGCSFESTLEAWYRFLIEPEPPARIALSNDTLKATPEGVDELVLSQRQAFLRPDSLVIIGMLSDENDCSVMDEGQGWLVAHNTPMRGATSACDSNPNDPCCSACDATDTPPACPPSQSDPACGSPTLAPADDALNLRCWDQKRRFGVDLLYPISRYVEGLSSSFLTRDASANGVENPLFIARPGQEPRDPGLVHVFGIIGVPWQDIAEEESLRGDGLRYHATEELEDRGRWDLMLGDPSVKPPKPPSDPFMVESVVERSGMHPLTFDAPVSSSATTTSRRTINGHEHADPSDLQYACIFPLETPRVCDDIAGDPNAACDCSEAAVANKSPLCEDPKTGQRGTKQYFAKAYPGTRSLELFRRVNELAVATTIASICPKDGSRSSPFYGYTPAVDAIVSRTRWMMISRCFPAPLPISERDGSVEGCRVITAKPAAATACDCGSNGWTEPTRSDRDKTFTKLQEALACKVDGTPSCEDYCLCEIPELTGEALLQCQEDSELPSGSGFCYVNAQQQEPNVGNPELVADCSPGQRRHVRIAGPQPESGSASFVICDKPIVQPRPAPERTQ